MYKVFLVEDEIYVLQSLKVIVKWAEYGFEIVGEAYNGVDAYEQITATKPDIVFTDIVMPRMNGLELIQKLATEKRDILFVVISGYAEFAYAQKVFNFGGISYCLKPFDANEIHGVLLKARDMLDKNKRIYEFKLLEYINDMPRDAGEEVEKLLGTLGFSRGKASGCIAVVSIGKGQLKLPAGIQSLAIQLGPKKTAYLVEYESVEMLQNLLLDSYPDAIMGVGISEVFHDFGQLGDIISEATLAAYRYFMTGKPGVFTTEDACQDEISTLFRSMDEAMAKKELYTIKKNIDATTDFFTKGSCNVRNLFRFYNVIISFLARMEDYSSRDYMYNYYDLFNSFENMSGMMEYLKKLTEKAFEAQAGVVKDDIKNETFIKILDYINEHYLTDINLQSIARNYIINPSYISQLFKKELDTTYTDYITGLRIRYAKNLLKTTAMQITEVSEKAGFNDYFYFAKVFKKATGKTPSEYKQTLADN